MVDEASSGQHTAEELGMLLEDARAKADEHWDLLLRARAEMDNLRRRSERELENAHKYAVEKLVQELLPVRDSLELGVAAAGDDGVSVDKLREGGELTLKMLGDLMEKFDISVVDPQGEAFNPEVHQAMTMQPSADVAPNTVVAVIQKGYLLSGRLMRPAMVVVSSAMEGAGSVDEKA